MVRVFFVFALKMVRDFFCFRFGIARLLFILYNIILLMTPVRQFKRVDFQICVNEKT